MRTSPTNSPVARSTSSTRSASPMSGSPYRDSLEIALALSLALANGFVGRAGRHRGCIALGCVIRGETTHYDIVARESAAGLHQLAVQHAVPIGFGILTCESREQAWERASVDGRNKGGDAARACLTLMQLERHFSSASRR